MQITPFLQKSSILKITILTLNWFHYNFFTIYERDDLTFCLLSMYINKVLIHKLCRQKIKKLRANHCFNHVGKFLTSLSLCFIIDTELFALNDSHK